MIYLYYGTDSERRFKARQDLLTEQKKKQPGLTIFQFSADDYSLAKLEEALVGQTLFASRFAVVLDEFWSSEPVFLTARLPELIRSPNLFLFLETELAPAVRRLVESSGGEVQEFSLARPQADYRLFNLVDAFAARERRKAWLLFEEILIRGNAAEEVFWKLVWKIKTLLLVKTSDNPSALDLKPYVLQQAQKHSRNFSLEELKKLSALLVTLWHDSRRGLIDFEHNLEHLILGI